MVCSIAETSSRLFVSARCSSIVNIFFRLGLSMDCADFRSFHAECNASCVRRNSSFRSRTFVPVCDRISEKLYLVWLWQHCLSAESIYCVSSLSMFWLLLVTHFFRCSRYRARLCGAVERRRLLLNCAGSSMFSPNSFVSSMSRYSPKWSETRGQFHGRYPIDLIDSAILRVPNMKSIRFVPGHRVGQLALVPLGWIQLHQPC